MKVIYALKSSLKVTASGNKSKFEFDVINILEPLLLSATLSNCGEALKLLYTKLCEKSLSGQGNDLGYGKSDKR